MIDTTKTEVPTRRELTYFSGNRAFRAWQVYAPNIDAERLLRNLSDDLPKDPWLPMEMEDYFLVLSDLAAVAAIAHHDGEIEPFRAVCALASSVEMANSYSLPATGPCQKYGKEIIRLCTHFVDACAITVETLPERDLDLDERNQPNGAIHNIVDIVRDLSSLSMKFNGTVFESPHIRVVRMSDGRALDAVLFKPDDDSEMLVLGDVVVTYSDAVEAVRALGGLNPAGPR